MICSKKDLKDYLDADRIALDRKRKSPSLFDLIWKFEISLRKNEYYNNCKHGFWWKPVKAYHGFKLRIISLLCGYEIPLNYIESMVLESGIRNGDGFSDLKVQSVAVQSCFTE